MLKNISITTMAALDHAVDSLPVKDCREALKQIATAWYVREDGALDMDKEIGSDELEIVTQALCSRGIRPRL